MLVRNVSEAKAQLSKLLEKVEAGEEIVIGRNGKPVAKLVPIGAGKAEWKPGALKGKIKIAADFDELPEDIARAFGMID
jgi:prevent-host-death family protein